MVIETIPGLPNDHQLPVLPSWGKSCIMTAVILVYWLQVYPRARALNSVRTKGI